jgi:hypothetical protein
MSKLKDLAGVPRNIDTGLRTLLEGLREHVRSMTGMDGRGQAINLTEETVQGIVTNALSTYTPPTGGGGGGGTYVPDYTEPPSPSGVSVTAGLSYLHIETDAATFTAGHGYERTIVYGTSWPVGGPQPVFADSVKMHEFIGTVTSIPVQLNTQYAIWLKWLSQDAILSATPAGGANGFQATTGKIGNADLGSLIVQAGNLAAGAVTAAKFDAAIEPVTLYTSGSLPTTKSTSTIFYGGKLYRWNGTAYVATVPTSDLSGTVSDAQIAGMAASKVSGTLTDAQLAAISAAKVTGQIVGTQITDGAVTTAKIFAGSITTAKIAADAVTSNEIAAGAVTATEIAAGAVTTAKLAAGAVTANEIAAGSIATGKLAANAVTASELAADAVTAGKIAAGAITAGKLAANAIAVGSAAIQDGAITNAMLGSATIDDAKVASLSAAKLTAGDGTIGGSLKSSNYSNILATGWIIRPDGYTEFNNVVIRNSAYTGTIYANAGTIGGITIASGYMRAGQYGFDNGSGFYLGSDGRFSLGDSSGSKLTWDGTNLNINGGGTFSGALSAATGTFAGVLSAATGSFAGSLSAATGTFSGALSAATGTFSGTLTADAVNAVSTVNIAGDAVIVPRRGAYYTAGNWTLNGAITAFTLPVIQFDGPARVVLFIRWFVRNQSSTQGARGGFRIKANGTTIYDTGSLSVIAAGEFNTGVAYDTPMFTMEHAPGSGAWTYLCEFYTGAGNYNTAESLCEATLIAIKK